MRLFLYFTFVKEVLLRRLLILVPMNVAAVAVVRNAMFFLPCCWEGRNVSLIIGPRATPHPSFPLQPRCKTRTTSFQRIGDEFGMTGLSWRGKEGKKEKVYLHREEETDVIK